MSTLFLLDTNIISDMMRQTTGRASQRFNARALQGGDLKWCTSVVVQCELDFGLLKRPNERLTRAYDRIVPLLEVLPLTPDVAEHYARLRTQLETIGQPIGPNDALIAAHALALDATLVSGDAEFLRVPGLKLENWLEAETTG